MFQISGTGTGTAVNLISSFKEPLEAPTFTNNRPHNPFVKGDTLFLSYYEDGVQMFNISDPLLPKRIAYFDTYTLQNGQGYSVPAHDWKGPWGVYPFLPSGCIVVGDISQGLFTFKLDMPVSDGSNVGKIAKIENSSVLFDSNTKGLVLRSDKGYCFRLKVSSTGTLTTEQIICHVNGANVNKIYKGDLAFTSENYSIILKDINNVCKKINATGGVLSLETVTCTSNPAQVTIQNSDLIVETYTKGLILNGKNACYRITVDNSGVLQVLTLNACP
ncbi:MAG: hypothetical protein IPO92_21500 [Saprospiraceae bacterium]|nr:hypothetical protein [Saprospiraceae bacterium]